MVANRTAQSRRRSCAAAWCASLLFLPCVVGSATGAEGSPAEKTIVINEVLTHSDPPLEDAVELHNPGEQDADVGGYSLTDDDLAPAKFRIPDGTVIPSGGYAVFYEDQFGPGSDPGSGFAFSSARREELFLFAPAEGEGSPTCVDRAVLGPAENGVSLGRFTRHTGKTRFVPMSTRTFGVDAPRTVREFRTGKGAPNSPPTVGPVVLNEIMYNPAGTDEEFLELYNLSDEDVNLYDPFHPDNTWKFDSGVEFSFPTGALVRAKGYCLVVGIAPRVFRRWYKVPRETTVHGPWTGRLKNKGESVALAKPDRPQGAGHLDEGLVPYVRVESIRYNDKDPWPEAADGEGYSLERVDPSAFGDDPANWHAGRKGGTPGRPNSPPPSEDAHAAD